MEFLSIKRVKYYNENDSSFRFIMSFEEGYITYDDENIILETKNDKQYTYVSLILKLDFKNLGISS
jgi:hypothetical protein